jgi:hypothetical protein
VLYPSELRGRCDLSILGRREPPDAQPLCNRSPIGTSYPDEGSSSMAIGMRCGHLVSSIRRLKRGMGITVVAIVLVPIALCAPASAQGLSSLTNLLGGGSSHSSHSGSSGQSNSGVTVQRNALPYVGAFSGQRTQTAQASDSGTDSGTSQSAPTSLSAQFACYPAKDSALPQTKTFVCYSAD